MEGSEFRGEVGKAGGERGKRKEREQQDREKGDECHDLVWSVEGLGLQGVVSELPSLPPMSLRR